MINNNKIKYLDNKEIYYELYKIPKINTNLENDLNFNFLVYDFDKDNPFIKELKKFEILEKEKIIENKKYDYLLEKINSLKNRKNSFIKNESKYILENNDKKYLNEKLINNFDKKLIIIEKLNSISNLFKKKAKIFKINTSNNIKLNNLLKNKLKNNYINNNSEKNKIDRMIFNKLMFKKNKTIRNKVINLSKNYFKLNDHYKKYHTKFKRFLINKEDNPKIIEIVNNIENLKINIKYFENLLIKKINKSFN